jgi:hypothetical protein
MHVAQAVLPASGSHVVGLLHRGLSSGLLKMNFFFLEI